MATAIKAVYEGGAFKPTEPVKLEEHTEVEADDDPTGWKTARRFIGLWKDAPTDDLAEAHDDCLYGPEK